MNIKNKLSFLLTSGVVLLTGCISSSSSVSNKPPFYVLAVASVNPLNVQIASIAPADNNSVSTGSTSLTLIYNPGTSVTLTALPSSTQGPFVSWTGCDSTSALVCTVAMSSNKNVTAQYTGVTNITLTPMTATVTLPGTVQFTGMVSGLGTCSVNNQPTPCQGSAVQYTLSGPTGYNGPLGTITSGGLYTTPYPAPPTVTVQAASVVNPSMLAQSTVTIATAAAATGPALSVDAGSPTHPINPYIYGMNDAGLNSAVPAAVNLPIERWGGNSTSRYNYLVDATNAASSSFFENTFSSTMTGYPVMSQINSQLNQDLATKTRALVTVPLVGYVSQRITACGYSVKKYGSQTAVDPNNTDCGNGLLGPLGGTSTGPVVNDPTDTSVTADQTFDGGWVKYLVSLFKTAANGGVAVYGLGNEPDTWNTVHKDIHPNPFTYDELTNKGIAYATAIKGQDASAQVSGSVIANWTDFFYSAQDIASGNSFTPGPCPQANPTDRVAHGNVPLIEYYLQQFQKSQTANGTRLLDYVDLHTNFAPATVTGLTGDTTVQAARLNSTRVFWDSTYTDPTYTDPTTTTCTKTPYPPNLINLMKGWVSRDYPGTKLAITSYNWGGQEAVSGALAQADILGIFGREGLDIGTLTSPPDPVKQMPGVAGFQVFTNYDGKNAHFGETAVTSTSANQGVLAVYGATRAVDNNLTVVVINKGYTDLTSTLTLANLKPNGTAKAYLYSNGNLTAIVAQPNVTVTASGTSATLSDLFPAQSITVLSIPKQ